ncbi:TPA: hypothetical protein EYP44_03990 [Candidatus Bathyarchaeota archaeon]|nr:hypothetical protein [Candidatus Bathyarchaeota archaeon]
MGSKIKVLHVSWEYPPRIVGEIAHCAKFLAENLSREPVDVYVVTFNDWMVGFAREGGVGIWRINNPVRTHMNIITWVITLTQGFLSKIVDLYRQEGGIDLIHAHEWHAVPAAVVMKHSLDLPFVYTVYSTENLRSGYSDTALNLAIKRIEWEGQYEAVKVLVQNEAVRADVMSTYNTPEEKIELIQPTYDERWVREVMRVYESALGGGPR